MGSAVITAVAFRHGVETRGRGRQAMALIGVLKHWYSMYSALSWIGAAGVATRGGVVSAPASDQRDRPV